MENENFLFLPKSYLRKLYNIIISSWKKKMNKYRSEKCYPENIFSLSFPKTVGTTKKQYFFPSVQVNILNENKIF